MKGREDVVVIVVGGNVIEGGEEGGSFIGVNSESDTNAERPTLLGERGKRAHTR